ncbi:histone-lysine N-methyltransferase SETMAR [Plakobranchus ocellatus]|uniref:Histone-lysine N-methyltransferase SETMAR n=1 Tax=Plakobranchus ocellatus TaxID=259542 RepID=A0AAV4B200_9GAST|nr:histone-lysine N-methyltransferase SETMAR [Plakobranchus ocellatus]
MGDEIIEVTKLGSGDLMVELKLNEQAKKLGAITTFLANYQVTRRKYFSVPDLYRFFREVNPSHIVGYLKELGIHGGGEEEEEKKKKKNCRWRRYGWEILPHPAHSPDLAPSDFHLFGPLKRHLGGMAFETEDDLISELRNWFDNLDVDFFRVGINSLLSRWQKCIDLHGDYVENNGRVNFNLCEFQIYLIKTL